MLAKLKSPWERGGFPLKCDRQIIELLKSVKTRLDKERKRRSMTDDEKRRVAENFSSTTLNLAPRNWLQAINEDKTGMRSDWRQEKIAFISDYIGVVATRTMTMSETQGFVRQSRADFAGEPSTSPPGSRRRGRPPGESEENNNNEHEQGTGDEDEEDLECDEVETMESDDENERLLSNLELDN